ncbi:MAG TPA: GNAT family N-acetyltransferase [Mycobacteriales bacterium]|nr:GNAT family N-acetyltransferase [Mycobacteriales bacterium]
MSVTVRPATEADLDQLVAYEIEIARISFGEDALTDAALHRKRITGSLGKPDEVALVAEDAGAVVGWVWLSGRRNSLTGDRYGNLRSLATSDVPGRSAVAEQLLAAALDAARERGVSDVVGKVHMRNVNMRAVYAKLGFAAEHLSMRKSL